MKTVHLLLVFALLASSAAQSFGQGWSWQLQPPDINPLRIELDWGGKLLDTHGLSWPDGSQASVMYFRVEAILYRCIDYFDKDMQHTGGVCYKYVVGTHH